jgi:urease accessory protein UreE
MFTLRSTAGSQAGDEFPLKQGENIVGRAGGKADVRLEEPVASRRHCSITVTGERAVVRDLGSKNGTRVNGALIQADTVLRPGDRLGVGDTELALVTAGRSKAEPAGDLGDGVTATLPQSKPGDDDLLLGGTVLSPEATPQPPPQAAPQPVPTAFREQDQTKSESRALHGTAGANPEASAEANDAQTDLAATTGLDQDTALAADAESFPTGATSAINPADLGLSSDEESFPTNATTALPVGESDSPATTASSKQLAPAVGVFLTLAVLVLGIIALRPPPTSSQPQEKLDFANRFFRICKPRGWEVYGTKDDTWIRFKRPGGGGEIVAMASESPQFMLKPLVARKQDVAAILSACISAAGGGQSQVEVKEFVKRESLQRFRGLFTALQATLVVGGDQPGKAICMYIRDMRFVCVSWGPSGVAVGDAVVNTAGFFPPYDSPVYRRPILDAPPTPVQTEAHLARAKAHFGMAQRLSTNAARALTADREIMDELSKALTALSSSDQNPGWGQEVVAMLLDHARSRQRELLRLRSSVQQNRALRKYDEANRTLRLLMARCSPETENDVIEWARNQMTEIRQAR